MKKRYRAGSILAIIVMLLFLTACNGSSDLKEKNMKSVKKEKEIELDVEDHIQKAIDMANLLGGESFVIDEAGNMFFQDGMNRDDLVFAYSYYDKGIKQVREVCELTLAMTEDGTVYNGTTKVSGDYKIKDMLWCTNNMNVDAYFVTVDGRVLCYNEWYGISDYGIKNIVAACRYRHDLISIEKNGKAHIMTLFDDDDDIWGKCEIDGWKNVAVIACTANENMETASVAAISADGTVYATGDYADEILSWGDLSYISMDENLIVGLKKDGTLNFAGPEAECFSSLDFGKVKGVRLWRERLWALTEQGYVVCRIGSSYVRDGELHPVSSENAGEGAYMVDGNGEIYQNKSGAWVKSNEYPSADAGASSNLVYYKKLSNDMLDWGTDRYTSNMRDTSQLSYQFCDVNQDGVDEILLLNGGTSHAEGYEGLGILYNGNIEMCIIADGISGYYPKSGIVVSSYMGGGVEISTYWKYEDVSVQRIVSITTNYNEDWENPTVSYYLGEDVEFERKSQDDIDMEEDELTEEEFHNLLDSYIGNEEMQTIDAEKYLKNTRENRIHTFLDPDQKDVVAVNGWDTVYFGNFYQEDTNEDEDVDSNDEKMPIQWRILWQDGDNALVLSEKVLEYLPYSTQTYHEENDATCITWEKCTLREWLNNEFYADAFSKEEQEIILEQTLTNTDNVTVDKVFLLSVDDILNENYGFSKNSEEEDKEKLGDPTEYAWRHGANTQGWWLRSLNSSCHIPCVMAFGGVFEGGSDCKNGGGIRPAMYINLSSTLVKKGERINKEE